MSVTEALELAHKGDLRSAEDAWMAALDHSETAIEHWTPVLETLVKAKNDGSSETLAWAAIEALQERKPPQEAIVHCSKIFRLFSKNDDFRNRAVELYKKAFPAVPTLDALIDISGLRGGKPIRRAIQTIDLCLAIQAGSFLVSKDDGPSAKVTLIDADSWNVRVATPKGEELLDPVTLGDQYEAADPDDFRVLQQFDPERFKKMLADDPAMIVLSIARKHGGEISSNDLEPLLSPRYVPANEWSKWWTRAKTCLKKDSRARLEGRNPTIVRFEVTTLSIDETMWAKFDIHASPKQWLELAKEYQRECQSRGQPVQNTFLRRLHEAARVEAAAMEKKRERRTLSAWLVVHELAQLAQVDPHDADILRVITAAPSMSDAFDTLEEDSLWPTALAVLKHNRAEHWPTDFAALAPVAPPNQTDGLISALHQAKRSDLIQDLPQKVLSDPVGYLNGLCYLYQGCKDTIFSNLPPLVTLTTRLLNALEQMDHAKTLSANAVKELRNRVRKTLSAKKYQRFDQCLNEIDEGMADALKSQVQRATGLSDANRSDMLDMIRSLFPKLWASKPRKKPWEDGDILYCTEAGFRAKEAELNELINVKMKENAIAIGEAAARGDLSENSEYKFALEERDLLRARVAEIQNQMSRARTIRHDEVNTDHIGISTQVDLKNNTSGQLLTLTFLGPWEANVEQCILNYQAPLSQKLMGLGVGESTDLDFAEHKGTFTIVAIRSGV